MKRIFITILTLASITASALAQQEKAEQLFDQFINDPLYKGCVKNTVSYRTKDGDNLLMRNESYTFALPAEWGDRVEVLAEELGKLQPSAYSFFMRRAGSGDNTKVNVTVERGNDIQLGAFPDRNYLAIYFHSDTDTLRRHAYVMAWYDDNEKESVKGSLYKIYGTDPNRKKVTLHTVRKIYVNGQEVDLGDTEMLRSMGLDMTETGRLFSSGGNHRSESTVTVVKGPKALKREETVRQLQSGVTSADTAHITTSTEFISEFKRLYDLFISLQGDYMTTQQFQTHILTRMDGMVQQKGGLLTMKEERQLCIKMLKNIKKQADLISDRVMAAHAELIIKKLKRK